MSNMFRSLLLGLYGYRNYTRAGFERRLPNGTMSDDAASHPTQMLGKVCIVTGANSGLGFVTARDLAKRGCTVHMLCRNEERGREALENIVKESGNDQVFLHLIDMASPKSIQHFLDTSIVASGEATTKEKQQYKISKLNILVNNAGAIVERLDPETKKSTLTKTESGGYEGNFMVNTLGPYMLTSKLIPLMEETARQDGFPSRVIVVSSGGQLTQRLDLNNLQNEFLSGSLAYAHCKRQMSIITEEWARTHDPSLVTFNSCHPGWSETPGVQNSLPGFYEKMKGNLRTLEQGADTQIYLAVSEDVKDSNGLFFEDRESVSPHFTLAFTKESDEERLELKKKCDEILRDATRLNL